MEVTSQLCFSLGACLGRGGFGEVYRATVARSGGVTSDVAVKLLRADLDLKGDAVRRLRDEGRILASLNHPSLLRVLDMVELDGRVALVTEFVDGQDLGELFYGPAAIPVRPLVQAIGSAADALHLAWTVPRGDAGRPLRLAHRDIKPSNLRLSRHGVLKVLDFGIAKTEEVMREARTATDLLVGSPAYMAPERFLDTEVRSASDVFALGCVLHEGLTGGVRLFGGVSVLVLSGLSLDAGRYRSFLASRELGEEVDSEVRALVDQCLAHDPEARPTARELAQWCDALADRVAGPSLRRWTRERDWSRPVEAGASQERASSWGLASGALVAPVVGPSPGTESLAIASIGPAPPRSPGRRGGRLGRWMGAAGLLALVGVVVLGLGLGLGVGLWRSGGRELVWGTRTPVIPSEVLPSAPDETPTEKGSSKQGRPSEDLAVAGGGLDPTEGGDAALEAKARAEASAVPEAVLPAPRRRRSVHALAPAPQPGTVVMTGGFTGLELVRGSTHLPVVAETALDVAVGDWVLSSTDMDNQPLAALHVTVGSGDHIALSCSVAMAKCRAYPASP